MCILPRVILSELDAIYCATFIHKLHSIRCTYFNTILTIDKIFNDILPFLVGFTENEGTALGKFMQLALVMLLKWRSDEAIYDKAASYITHLKMRKVKLWEANEISKQTKTFSILPPSLIQERKRPASPIPPVDKIEPKVRKVVVEKQKEKVVEGKEDELKTEEKELTREKEKRGGKEKEKRRESNKVSVEGVKEREKERHESSKERTIHAEREGKKERGAEKETTRRRERAVEREKETDEERGGDKEEVDIGPALPPKRHEKREKERGREKEKEKKKKSEEEESSGASLPLSDRVDRDSRHSKERTVDRKQDRKSPSIRERVRIRPLSISPSPKEKEHRRRKETSSRR